MSRERRPMVAILGWGKSGKVTSAGWQVTLCGPIWHVIFRSGVVISITNCYIRVYFTFTFTFRHPFEWFPWFALQRKTVGSAIVNDVS